MELKSQLLSPDSVDSEANRLADARQLIEKVDLFGDIVSHSYLQRLTDCEIIDLEDVPLSSMRWYAITKVVIEKGTFFPDKLSMLYMSLHSVARNVVMVVNKDINSKIQIYLGARDFSGSSNISGEILEAGLHGFLSGVKTSVYSKGTPGNTYDKPFVSCVSGIASLRDDKKENFVQGIEKLINATSEIPQFTTYFIADNVSDDEAKSIISSFNDLHNQISPFLESQLTVSENKTEGVSESLTESFSNSISKSLSHTVTNTEGFSESTSHTTGKSHTDTKNSSHSGGLSFILSYNYSKSHGTSDSTNESDTIQKGSNTSQAIADQTGETTQEQRGNSKQTGTNESTTKGASRQINLKNNHAKLYTEILEEQIKRLRTGIPFGLWSTSAYFVAADSTTSATLANLYRGCIVGEDSNTEAFAVNVWKDRDDNKRLVKYLEHSIHPRFFYNNIDVSAGSVVTSEELAIHLSLPQTSIPGLLVREEESFGRNVIPEAPMDESNSIEAGVIRHLGEDYEDDVVRLSINGLSKHTFVTGTTGSGKSNTLYLLISQLKERGIKFLIIEPAKGEYKEVFGSMDGVRVFGSNVRVSELLTINPFVFPEEIDVYEHIDSLVEIFNACWPMYAAMPQVLKHSIIEAYKACGWNLENSYNPDGTFPTVTDVLDCLKDYINNSEYSADTKGDYKGSLETRLQSLCEGVVGRMFNGQPIPDETLFNENVIIDLSRVKSSETKSLLMGLLVLKLNEFRMSEHKGMNVPLRHVTVLEEAHNLLKRTSTEQSSESSNVAGMAVEKIANSMAEMRTYGEGFIIADQSPALLDSAAIRNTNTKVIMALPEKDDREIAGKALGLDDKHIDEISRLKTGEAIVYQTGWEEPVKSKIGFYKIASTPWNYVPDYNIDSDNRKNAMQSIFSGLYDKYTGGTTEIDIPKLIENLKLSGIPGGRIHAVIDKFHNTSGITSDDIAFIFATIVGPQIYDSAKSTPDINIFNAILGRGLNSLAGLTNDPKTATYVNMYVKGCSIKSSTPFYDGWLKETSKNK